MTEQGIKIDSDKIKSIVDMNPPKDKKEFETFTGMITYITYISFIPSFATKNAILRESPVLQYYNVNKPVVLSVDVSKSGLGVVLLQDGLAVACASKASTRTEQRYAQIEKEALAIAFGCIKFDQQMYGKEILVESDHKPIESILPIS